MEERKNVSARCRHFVRSKNTLSYSANKTDGWSLFCRPLDLGVGQLRYPVECRAKGDGIRIADSEQARSCLLSYVFCLLAAV